MNKDRRLGSGDFKVTTEQVSQWVGNDGYEKRGEDLLDIVTEIANGEYSAEDLNYNIRCYDDEAFHGELMIVEEIENE